MFLLFFLSYLKKLLVHESIIEKNIYDNQKKKYEVFFPKRKIRKSNYYLEVVQTERNLHFSKKVYLQVISTGADNIYSYTGR